MAKNFPARLAEDQRGASAVEYAILLGFMAVLLVAGISAVGAETSNKFNSVENGFPD
ncbi:MAG: Flp family type IVb pilin [Henriciella sp.]|jgi:Flp pilus assembly pilin Flp|uniref:Flp family type IVb pilin n=1 Tax=Henriciella sp. TaxID=1968823 RepID=UPI000C0E78AD|nr:Flp family type IVb pilin [Henriciella sp.]MAN72601.1 Flp family type IVb pilin [Henriciella sp.]MBF33139.1 Flp family type IVb pilin [Hyphomonadaceae bacterium]MBK74953.1 Flp family type IVb pilin [Henriciella sp.]PHR82957.1 MAG: Flp family type IVb pilin [Henriciella sp.]|tara:strand:- start:882 stop:1052 length:171 start_codon:yes stop_codon:yes gene_type:complete